MSNIAIRGHATRGKEVIEILEMLGGKNIFDCSCHCIYNFYYINEFTKGIQFDKIELDTINDFTFFTLEEFLEKFPYRVGDKALLYGDPVFITKLELLEWIEGLVACYVYYNGRKLIVPSTQLQPYKKQETMEEQIKIDIPKGYKFSGVDNQQVVFEKISSQYPKNFKECCEVLGCKANNFFTNFSYDGCDVEISDFEDKIDDLLQNFRKLIYYRNTYWKIAGEQMELDKPWEPDLENEELYCIQNYNKQIIKSKTNTAFNKILIFPSEEMRDVFLENFKNLIEKCKELL